MAYEVDVARKREIAYRAGDTTLVGALFEPPTEQAETGVLLFPEWWGLDDYALWRASRLSEMGHQVFVADMYGDGVVTSDAHRAASLSADTRTGALARRRATVALDTLLELSNLTADSVVAMGYCFGGSVALEFARSGATLAGVVACHASLATPMTAGPGTVTCPILVLHGGDDPLVTDAEVDQFHREMDKAGVDWRFVTYEGAQHSFTRPDADEAGIEGVAYDPEAEVRSWQEVQDFLSRTLPNEP